MRGSVKDQVRERERERFYGVLEAMEREEEERRYQSYRRRKREWLEKNEGGPTREKG